MRPSSRALERGSALVITLAILVIITVLAVGLSDSVRMDRSSSSIHSDRARALLLAQAGPERVVAKLRKSTGDSERHWISQPGQIVVGAEEDDADPNNGDLRKILTGAKAPEDNPGPTDPLILYLHSGRATQPFTGPAVFAPPNLNIATFAEPTNSLITDRVNSATGVPEEMPVRWIYMRKDGTNDLSEIPDLTDKTNPIIGRYAYWTDDETAKVNYNLAWKKDAADPLSRGLSPGHPSRVSLAALDGFAANPALADSLHGFVTSDNYVTLNRHFFNSPEDARRVSSEVGAALHQNKFEVTHYNHSPNTTFFNEPKIVLTTQASRAEGRPYLKVLADETKDPGLRSNLDEAKLNETLFGVGGTYHNPKSPSLLFYMSRKDWPMVSGSSSLQDKYYSGDPTQLIEFAINIIDYVRSAESSMDIVEQIRGIPHDGLLKGEWVAANKTLVPGGVAGAESTFKGLTRQPLITEMAILLSTVSANNCRIFVEIHLPVNYGLESIDLGGLELIFQIRKDGVLDRDVSITRTPFSASTLISGTEGTILKKGGYCVFSTRITVNPSKRPIAGEKVDLRAVLNIPPPKDIRLDMAPVGDPRDMYVPRPIGTQYTVPTLLTSTALLNAAPLPALSMQTDDPRVSGIGPDWQLKNATWGAPNPVAAPIANLQPQQDTTASWTDSAGKLVGTVTTHRNASLHMPAPKGSAKNPDGAVASVGELGFIHTGLQITSQKLPATVPPKPNQPGIPWRTIRFQPSSAPASAVPDWVLMDLFSVPQTVPNVAKRIFTPHDSASGGMINLNSRIEPFGMARTLPLAAVFQDASRDATVPTSTVSAIDALTIAKNIEEGKLADGGKRYGYEQGYDSPGELVEIAGIADRGEASEELVRQTSNLVTARGNVFSVYSIGQALKQTPNGGLLVMAEQRRQTIIERYVDTAKKVRFGTVYTRHLTP